MKNKIILHSLIAFILTTNSAFAISLTQDSNIKLINGVYQVLENTPLTPICEVDEIYQQAPSYFGAQNCGTVLNGSNITMNAGSSYNLQGLNYNGDYVNGLAIDILYVTNFVYPQIASPIFAFVNRDVSKNTGASTSAFIIPTISNLWPIMLIIIGILLTFYVLEKIIEMFKKATKENNKKSLKEVKDTYSYDEHGNIKSITFGKKKDNDFPNLGDYEKPIKEYKRRIKPLNLIAPEYTEKSKSKGGNIF
jgi:uncharacterized membrane protein